MSIGTDKTPRKQYEVTRVVYVTTGVMARNATDAADFTSDLIRTALSKLDHVIEVNVDDDRTSTQVNRVLDEMEGTSIPAIGIDAQGNEVYDPDA